MRSKVQCFLLFCVKGGWGVSDRANCYQILRQQSRENENNRLIITIIQQTMHCPWKKKTTKMLSDCVTLYFKVIVLLRLPLSYGIINSSHVPGVERFRGNFLVDFQNSQYFFYLCAMPFSPFLLI